MTAPRKEVLAEGVEIWLGDCREVLPLIDPKDVVVVSDVPYGVGFKSGWDNKFRGICIKNDASTEARDWVVSWMDGAPGILFGSWKIERPKGTRTVLTWDKGTVGMGDLSLPWFPCTEEIYVLGDGFVGTRTSAVYRAVGRNQNHPTEKPVGLMRQLVEKCDPALVVLDPFLGSGSTGLAAVELGRRFVGVEIEVRYFDIAARRISEALRQPDFFVEPPKPSPKQEALSL